MRSAGIQLEYVSGHVSEQLGGADVHVEADFLAGLASSSRSGRSAAVAETDGESNLRNAMRLLERETSNSPTDSQLRNYCSVPT